MIPSAYFAPDYFSARRRFIAVAEARGARLASYPIAALGPGGEPLSIDTAYIGPSRPTGLLIVLSGTHGVEGFMGSALQQLWLEKSQQVALDRDAGCLLVHAVNPFGFAWQRRTNENNVDINRNALEQFPGPANPAYAQLNAWLNPPTPPRRLDFFWTRGAWLLLTQGLASVKQATAGGQYQFPQSIFYGGERLEASTARLAEILSDATFSAVERAVAIDLHTGLGRFATYRLLVDFAEGAPPYGEMVRWFGAAAVASNQPERSIAYRVSGGLLGLIERAFPCAQTFPAVLEFGTVSLTRMIATLRRENRAYVHAAGSPAYTAARAALVDVFRPDHEAWQRRVLEQGVRVLAQGCRALEDRAAKP